ncbi:hypothetical protein LCGC14_2754700 [marine sediment metagenome]|uniref:Uncharacterized protein n=1 Tax=marine sediment metagenome TaxID=412755 RepID=A0A0F8Z0L6_9ZZZZ
MSKPISDEELQELRTQVFMEADPPEQRFDSDRVERFLDEIDRLRAEVVAAKADSERVRTAISKAKVGDWLLNWFGENAPAYDPGEGSGYTYAQIADCTNDVCKHLDDDYISFI